MIEERKEKGRHKIKIMIRKEIINEPKQKIDEDKNKKKEVKKEESVSSWSVESVEIIKENGIFKKMIKNYKNKSKKVCLIKKRKKMKN